AAASSLQQPLRTRGRAMKSLLTLALFLVAAGAPTDPQFRAGKEPGRVEVIAALPAALRTEVPAGRLTQEQGERLLRLGLGSKGVARPPPYGPSQRKTGDFVFPPRHALSAGQRYRAVFEPRKGEPRSAEYLVPKPAPGPPGVVQIVYPTAAVLPAN